MLGVVCFLIIFVDSSSSLKCSEPVRSVKGKYLKDHVISSGRAAGLGDCLVECLDVPRCESINFRFKDFLCELNDANRYTHPWDYGSSEEHAYSDIQAYKVSFTELRMTSWWLEAHASYIDSSHCTTADQITFIASSLKNSALLKVPLVPYGVLPDGTPLTVEITVRNDVSIGEIKDSDIKYGVSDGTNFIGFFAVDKGNYNIRPPCSGIEATSGINMTDIKEADRQPIQNAKYPEYFVFTLKLEKQWGSCLTTRHGEAFRKAVNYTRQLMLSQGLTLEVYKSNSKESVGIKYIEVTIR